MDKEDKQVRNTDLQGLVASHKTGKSTGCLLYLKNVLWISWKHACVYCYPFHYVYVVSGCCWLVFFWHDCDWLITFLWWLFYVCCLYITMHTYQHEMSKPTRDSKTQYLLRSNISMFYDDRGLNDCCIKMKINDDDYTLVFLFHDDNDFSRTRFCSYTDNSCRPR